MQLLDDCWMTHIKNLKHFPHISLSVVKIQKGGPYKGGPKGGLCTLVYVRSYNGYACIQVGLYARIVHTFLSWVVNPARLGRSSSAHPTRLM